MALEAAICPCCAAQIQIPEEKETTFCSYCGAQIKTKAAISYYKIELSGQVEVKGIATLDKLLKNGYTFMKLNRWDDAIRVFTQVTNEYPEDYRAWWEFVLLHTHNLSGYFNGGEITNLQNAYAVADPTQREKIYEQYEQSKSVYYNRVKSLCDGSWSNIQCSSKGSLIFRLHESSIVKDIRYWYFIPASLNSLKKTASAQIHYEQNGVTLYFYSPYYLDSRLYCSWEEDFKYRIEYVNHDYTNVIISERNYNKTFYETIKLTRASAPLSNSQLDKNNEIHERSKSLCVFCDGELNCLKICRKCNRLNLFITKQ